MLVDAFPLLKGGSFSFHGLYFRRPPKAIPPRPLLWGSAPLWKGPCPRNHVLWLISLGQNGPTKKAERFWFYWGFCVISFPKVAFLSSLSLYITFSLIQIRCWFGLVAFLWGYYKLIIHWLSTPDESNGQFSTQAGDRKNPPEIKYCVFC